MRRRSTSLLVLLLLLATAAPAAAQRQPVCAADNAGLKLPSGFCALIVADTVRGARHLVVAPNGDVFVATRNTRGQRDGGVIALRDTTGDGKADVRVKFGTNGGTGIALRGSNLWFATDDAVLRYTLSPGKQLAPERPDTIVRDLPTGGHSAKSIALGRGNDLYVNIGSRTNACQVADRQASSRGHDPCTELETRAGIWRFSATEKKQRQTKSRRFATGLRNVVAIHFNRYLYGAQHGRDNLSSNWGEHFTDADNAEKPAEILVRIRTNQDYGWPYCYYDGALKKHVLAPEYGGDGSKTWRCEKIPEILAAYPAHWAPNGLLLSDGDLKQFPKRYHEGFFIAFHGSWNRAPLPQGGYNVVFQPADDGKPEGDYEVFADGFAGTTVGLPQSAQHRPTGLAVGPDGSLYISDDVGGRIYRILYRDN